MATVKRKYKKKTPKSKVKSYKTVMSPVITVRISDEEKERIDGIMVNMDIRHYSDVMRMALHMMKPDIGYAQASIQ